MKRKISLLILTLILTLSLLLTVGCKPDFGGENPDLCSVAWVNLPGAIGYSSNGEVTRPPSVLLLETDSEGRRLYYYKESRSPYWHILIAQMSEGESVYYYPDDCYLSYPDGEQSLEIGSWDDVRAMIYERVSAEELSAFKSLNDWDKPINRDKCESTPILTRKSEGKSNPDGSRLEEYAKEYYARVGRYIHPRNSDLGRSATFLACDSYGRELYVVDSRVVEYGVKSETTYYYSLLMVIMPDGSCNTSTIILVENPNDCRDAIKQIKLDNNWNLPIE